MNDQNFFEAIDLMGRSTRAANYLLDNWWMVLLAIGAIVLFRYLRACHATIAALDERCEAAFADIDALLAERHALVGNLVETVKGFAWQEHAVLKDVTDARARAVANAGMARLEAEAQIGQSVNNLLSIAENYPELTSSGHFRELRVEMARMEDRITASRRFYNLAVEELNSLVRSFPGNLLARFAGSSDHAKFTVGERRTEMAEPVRVSF